MYSDGVRYDGEKETLLYNRMYTFLMLSYSVISKVHRR